MKRRIWQIVCAIVVLVIGIFIWRLDIPHWKKLDLDRIYAQPKSTIVLDQTGNVVETLASSGMRIWTPIEEIPQSLQQAFLAAEDQRFYEHSGINIRRIAAAALNNLRTRSYSQGASTITQQLIKLTHLSETKTLSRKAQEAWLSIQLERQLSKNEILECYLNTVYFGKGAYGVSAAAQTYFSKELTELTLAESALLAGIIKAPSGYAPHIDADKSISRRNHILGEMAQCGYITSDQAASAKSEELHLVMRNDANESSGWFTDAVLSEASNVLFMSVDEVLCAGYTIYTAFDPALQSAMDALFEDDTNFPIDASDGTCVQAAMVAMRPDSGEICALIGGRRYEVKRGLNRATQIQRSPGSAIKPVSVYAAAIDRYDFTPTSLIDDTPRTFSGGYTPKNAGGSSYGTVTLREALSRSLNIATVDLADVIGVDSVRNYAVKFGLNPDIQDSNLALALGSMTYGVSPAQLCAAYSSLSNGGIKVEAHLISRITDTDGHTIYHANESTERAVQDSTAYMLTDMLKTAASSGSAKALSAVPFPVAGKTGTVADSDGSTRDIWTAAYTPDLALTVWMGYDSPDAEHHLSSSEGGSGYPARLCAEFLSSAASQMAKTDFVRPDSVRAVLVDSLALEKDKVQLSTDKTPSEYVRIELFHPDHLPDEYSSEWTAPESISDLTLISERGQTPILQFTALSENAEYLLLRTTENETQIIATLTGAPGEILRYADESTDLTQTAQYTILPRHRLLFERGELLTGKESAAVTYSPGGILDWLSGNDASSDTESFPDIEYNEIQSLFS